jgi:hypothetical protein
MNGVADPPVRASVLYADGPIVRCADCYGKVAPGKRCPCWKDHLSPADRELLQRAIVVKWEDHWKAIDLERQQIAARAITKGKWGSWGNRNAVGGMRRTKLGR